MSDIEFSLGPWNTKHEVDTEGLHIFWVSTLHESTVAKCFNPANAQLISVAPEMYAVLKLYEEWESELLMNDSAWVNGLPKFTQSLYDKWMEIQRKRNEVLAKAEGNEV